MTGPMGSMFPFSYGNIINLQARTSPLYQHVYAGHAPFVRPSLLLEDIIYNTDLLSN